MLKKKFDPQFVKGFQETDLAGHPSGEHAIRCACRIFDRCWRSNCCLSSGPNICAVIQHEYPILFFHMHQQIKNCAKEMLSEILFSPVSVASRKVQVPESKAPTWKSNHWKKQQKILNHQDIECGSTGYHAQPTPDDETIFGLSHFCMACSRLALKRIGLMTWLCFTPRSMVNLSLPWTEPVCPRFPQQSAIATGTPCCNSASKGGLYSMRTRFFIKLRPANHIGAFHSKNLEEKHSKPTNASSMLILGRNPIWYVGWFSPITTPGKYFVCNFFNTAMGLQQHCEHCLLPRRFERPTCNYRIVNIQQTFLQRMLLCLNIPATMPSASASEGCTKP